MSMTTLRCPDMLRSDRLRRLAPLAALAFCGASSAPPAAAQQVTYAKDVAPIFQAKCTQCHHAGTGAPMPLTSFEEVRPWARSIKTRVSNREMPPWHLDKTVGIRHYKNDLSLNEADIATIVKWVDAGAPGRHGERRAAAAAIRARGRLAYRQARSGGAHGRRAHHVRQRDRTGGSTTSPTSRFPRTATSRPWRSGPARGGSCTTS